MQQSSIDLFVLHILCPALHIQIAYFLCLLHTHVGMTQCTTCSKSRYKVKCLLGASPVAESNTRQDKTRQDKTR